MQKIVLATNNQGKIMEFKNLLSDFKILPQAEFNISDIDETCLSFIENSILKARNAAKLANIPAIADDSGLVIPALGGEPGIISSRYSGGNDNDNINMVLHKMKDIKNRDAYFYCVISYVKDYKDPTPIIGIGKLDGQILDKKQGENGFGYDPIFYLPQFNKTTAELTSQEKDNISHRSLAVNDFLAKFNCV